MKANEYIKENGLAEARKLLEMGRGFVKLSDDGGFHTDDLKRLVESHELIKKFHGVEKAKYELKLIEEGSIFRCCVAITAEMLRQAIADVEACQ